MDTQTIIKPASLEEAFELELKPVKSTNIIENQNINNSQFIEVESKINISDYPGKIADLHRPKTTIISFPQKPFIEANTQEVKLYQLKNDCVIPVFSKDNERTIAHQEFIEIAQNCASKVFSHHSLDKPEIRVSHQIKGRTPDAIHLPVNELQDFQRTQYFERMAFIIRIPSIVDSINGNEIALTIGGVRSYNLENLYNKKSFEKFKFFIGFQVKV